MIPFAIWGCIPEVSTDCLDTTNASSAYLGILIGAIIGGLVSWLVYNRQKKTTEKQDLTLESIKKLNERHDKILKTIESIEEHNRSTLEKVLNLEKQITALVKRRNEKESQS
jgi:gas vesicle protein